MKVLGIHIGHDSSAALVEDGQVVADVAEERFTRVKHYAGLPIQALGYCLKSKGLSIKDIDAVAVSSQGTVLGLNHLLGLEGNRAEQRGLPGRVIEAVKDARGASREGPPIYFRPFKLPIETPIVHVEHHLAHAASAYFTSGSRDKQLVVTMDGSGDQMSTCIWRGENGRIKPLKKYGNTGSLGLFYGNVTEALGWIHGDGEGKTMGLAPYGDPERIRGVLNPFHPKFENGDLIEPHDFGPHYRWEEKGALQWHLEEAADIQKLVEKHGAEHIAAEAQRVLEEQSANLIYPWLEREGVKFLTCSGGIFLNVKLNQRIWESGKVECQHIYPNAGDSGLAAGAALQVYFDSRPKAEIPLVTHLYTGPEYSDEEIEEILKLRKVPYHRVDNPARFAAKALADNKIVAWFQGRMESGPRALGNRSILMSANRAENKDIINALVKFREAFRPFCPSLQWEKRNDYMLKARDENFMITSFDCREEKRDRVPSIVHADGTMRPQTVKRDINPIFWELIEAFGEITGEYLLLNSSFNVMGEPIVCHPREAIRCFYDNGLDHLVMGSLVLSKE